MFLLDLWVLYGDVGGLELGSSHDVLCKGEAPEYICSSGRDVMFGCLTPPKGEAPEYICSLDHDVLYVMHEG